MNRNSLSRLGVAGVVVAVAGVVLFVVLWAILGQMGVDTVARLLVAFCLPPALLALVIGAYILVVKPKRDV